MIKSLTVINHLGEELDIELKYPEDTGFIIQSISGIGPDDSDVNTTELASDDGSIFNSARSQERQITIDLIFTEDKDKNSIEVIRHRSYKYFPKKRPITLVFNTDERECYIEGYVKKNDPDIFNKQEGCQIEIICPYPYFYSVVKQQTSFNGVDALFEFPFSNESLDEKLINFGNIVTYSQRSVLYEGDAPTGIVFTIHAIGDITGFTIYNVNTKERISIKDDRFVAVVGSNIKAGDDIIISTVKRRKSATLFRDGEYINILNVLDKNLDWFQIDKGDNIFAYTVSSGIENVQLTIENEVLYEGV